MSRLDTVILPERCWLGLARLGPMRFALAPFGLTLCGLTLCGVMGCASAYQMDAPASFRPYDEAAEPKWITSDGVMLKVRSVENYPKAELSFWVEAMREHLVRQGYAATSTRCFKTKLQLDGCRLDFLLPHGNEDWVLSETLFVVDDDVHLVEAAGPYNRFARIDTELQTALSTFRVGDR